ncbi:MAG: prepilin-type N-terminal cleavage/methylation domain-containing protein [Kiritimatiellae bacterium]|jgi:prepilin-type N-terminal cleavage/methylation domain-containing protein|nr:prepilin-type N-terminal cleavage/methylation domain-containing protein [Kiritimatiellia bacterium]
MNRERPKIQKTKRGFTLAEILLAMLVFAIAITTILALLARSVETAQEILTKDEAIGLSSAVENYMTSIPFYADPASGPNAYQIVRDEIDLFAYKYRGDPANPRTDGTLTPVTTGGEVVPGVRYAGNNPELRDDIEALDSRLFRVTVEVSPANPLGDGALPANPNTISGSELSYNSAVLVVYARFFAVPAETFEIRDGDGDFIFEPVFSFNFAVRR